MSVTKASPSVRAAASIIYAYYGRPADFSRSRAAGELSDFASPMDAVEQMEAMTRGTGRKNQALTIIQSFSKEEIDASDPEQLALVTEAGYRLARPVAPGSPCVVVTHDDSEGGHPHNHIIIANHDLETGMAARGGQGLRHHELAGANDAVMREMGLQVVARTELAHDVNRSRAVEKTDLSQLSVDELDKSTWREFLADRVDEALQDSRSVDLDSLAEVAKEHGVSIRAKTGKRATGLTYALVDENGVVRRNGRSKFASTGTKLGADYTYEEVLVSIQQLREAEKEIDDEQGYGEGDELSAAVARLAADGPRRGGAGTRHRDGEAGGTVGVSGGGDRGAGEGDVHARFASEQHAALRAALARERTERDREDAERDRADRVRRARREAAERRKRERRRPLSALPGVEAGEADRGDDFQLE